MRKAYLVALVWLACGGFGYGAQAEGKASASGEAYAGTWAGTWDGGGGAGNFELVLEKAEGTVTGKVTVTNPDYEARFKSVAFDKNTMKAKYDFPPDNGAEVWITATFEGTTAKGTWSLHPGGQSDEMAGGTWTVTKK